MSSIFYKIKLVWGNTQNPIDLLIYYFGIKKETTCKLKYDMGQFKLNPKNKYLLGRNVAVLDYLIKNNEHEKLEQFKNLVNSLNDEYIDINGIKFVDNVYSSVLWEYFLDFPYLDGELKGRTVIDIGANIGDTALHMANKGAFVHAFEPVPQIFKFAERNIEINSNLKKMIKLYNYAIGVDGFIDIFIESLEQNTSANSFIKSGEKIEVQSYSIETIMEKFSIKPDILKMDCEGAEYTIIENSDLSMFNKIILEYHQKFVGTPYNILVERLEEMGFNVIVEENSEFKKEDFGFIIATK